MIALNMVGFVSRLQQVDRTRYVADLLADISLSSMTFTVLQNQLKVRTSQFIAEEMN